MHLPPLFMEKIREFKERSSGFLFLLLLAMIFSWTGIVFWFIQLLVKKEKKKEKSKKNNL